MQSPPRFFVDFSRPKLPTKRCLKCRLVKIARDEYHASRTPLEGRTKLVLKLERFQNKIVEAQYSPLTGEEWESLLKSIGELKFWPQFGKYPPCPIPITPAPQVSTGPLNFLSSATQALIADTEVARGGEQQGIGPGAVSRASNHECEDKQSAGAQSAPNVGQHDAEPIYAWTDSNPEVLQAELSDITDEKSALNALETPDETMDTSADHFSNFDFPSFQIADSTFDVEENESAELNMEFRGFLKHSGTRDISEPNTVAPLDLMNSSSHNKSHNSTTSLPAHPPKTTDTQTVPSNEVPPSSMMRLVDAGDSDAMGPDEALHMLQDLQNRDLNILGSMMPGLAFSRQDMRQKLAQRELMLSLLMVRRP